MKPNKQARVAPLYFILRYPFVEQKTSSAIDSLRSVLITALDLPQVQAAPANRALFISLVLLQILFGAGRPKENSK
jgi:hypothetical protein